MSAYVIFESPEGEGTHSMILAAISYEYGVLWCGVVRS